jgi:MFS family permease
MCLGTVYSWSIFRIPVEEFFSISTMQSGLPYMVSLAFYAFSMFTTGKYLDKYSPKSIILIGGVLVGLGWILSGYAANIYILTVSYGIILGTGVGIVYGVPMTAVAKWFPEKKGLMVGFVLVGFGLSPFITAPIARHLVESYGIMQSFKMLGISFGVIIALLGYLFRYPDEYDNKLFVKTPRAIDDMNDINTEKMIKTASFKGLYLSFIVGTMIGLMLIGMTSNVGIELIQLSPRTVALLMSVFAVFNGMGRPIFGWITDKLSYKKAMLISFVSIIIAAILMLMAKEGSLGLFSIAFSIFWFNLGGWLAIAPTSTLAIYGTKHYSQNYGVVFTAYGIGAILGVLISGYLKDIHQGYHSIFYFVIVLCMAGILLSQKIKISAKYDV